MSLVSFFSTVPIKAGQRPLSAGGTALPAVGGCSCAAVKVLGLSFPLESAIVLCLRGAGSLLISSVCLSVVLSQQKRS